MEADIPTTEPVLVAPETYLIPHLAPAEPGLFVPTNSLIIRGAEPVIVDTGAPVYRDSWLDMAFSVVEPADVRWIFLSHDDPDHTGSLLDVLELCPQATLVTTGFSVERLALEKPALPLERMRWIEPGGSFRAGDRTMHLFRPPIFDGPTTRGLFDDRTATMWAVDSFAAFTTGAVHHVGDLPSDLVAESMPLFCSMVSPWHAWLDPAVYRRHVDQVEAMGVLTVTSAHGPVLTGDAIRKAFDVARGLAGQSIIPGPGQETLDELLAAVVVEPAA